MVIDVCMSLTPWLMEPVGSMAHSQGLSNNSYPEPNQPPFERIKFVFVRMFTNLLFITVLFAFRFLIN